jgi:hypothetical protein
LAIKAAQRNHAARPAHSFQRKLYSHHHDARRLRRIIPEYYVPHPRIPDPGKIVALFPHNQDDAFLFIRKQRIPIQTGAIHYDDAFQSRVRLLNQLNPAASVLQQQITYGIRVSGILDGHLNSFHPHWISNVQLISHQRVQMRTKQINRLRQTRRVRSRQGAKICVHPRNMRDESG